MPSKRDLLAHLTRDELLALVARFELPVSDRRVRDQLIDAIVQARSADLFADELNGSVASRPNGKRANGHAGAHAAELLALEWTA
ncbi:hypothetical protein WME99_32760 [Sorangium sp. So ce136]|uniref:hypothetical protein n=1 Tax=Sorangium sp. So ce136 TaxID=3133284 RepID=UPI003F05D40F